jgi:hypothetical protein
VTDEAKWLIFWLAVLFLPLVYREFLKRLR